MSGEEEESSNSRIVERQEIEDAAAVEETDEEQERNAASVASHLDSTLLETTEAMSSSTTSSSTTDSEGSRPRDELDHDNHHPGENHTESLTLAPAREHTYLPGTSHPLFPENMLSQRRRHRSSSFVHTLDNDNQGKRNRTSQRQTGLKNDSHSSMSSTSCPAFEEEQKQQRPDFVELAILELRNVVLFPGSTIPIRLQNPSWIDYLGRKIDASRMLRGISSLESSAPDEEVRLGILTHVEETSTTSVRDPQRQRMSWARTGINRLQGQRLSLVLQQYLLDSDNDHEDASDDAERSEGYSADDSDEHLLRRRTSNGNNISNSNNNHQDANTRQDPVIGRIGTIATITYTHEADDDGDIVVDAVGDSQSRVWQSQRSRQIVVTALGTGRFRIVSRAEDNRNTLLRLYKVEELDDEPVSYPSVCFSQRPIQSIPVSISTSSPSSSHYMKHQEQLIQKLATVTPIPTFVYRMLWPWRMVGLIRLAMDEIADFEGLRNALPSLDDSCSADTAALLLEPVHFSFWMASNMPFSQDEKLHLLKLLTPIERLRFIYKKVKRHQRESNSTPNMLCCRWCGIPFASVSSIFTVGGAEGTTGAYVNEYGVIHQTITLRQVNEDCLQYSGGPETRDSWFPGYSWTIASCRFCRSHLGWKFLRVQAAFLPLPENEPIMFFGMSAGNVKTMHVASSHARRLLHQRDDEHNDDDE